MNTPGEIPDFEYELGTDLQEIAALADSVVAWGEACALGDRELVQINLVLEELVTNVVVHGFGVGRPGHVRVRISHRGGSLALELRDSAPPFDPFQVPPPNLTPDIDKRQVGGLGIHFVRIFMDNWHYARHGGENVVSLRKVLGKPAASGRS